jgi:hypothetical protein
MQRVNTVEEFKRKNEHELRSFMAYKTGIFNKELHDEAIQEFYVKLIETRALETFDPNYENKPRRFDTYIMTLFCYLLPELKKNNHRARYPMVTKVNIGHHEPKMIDIWEFLNKEDLQSEFAVDRTYSISALEMRQDDEMNLYVKDFIGYVKRTEPEKKANRMITYLTHKLQGCNGTDIAQVLGVSNNMVKFIKNDLYEAFNDWKD